MRSYNNPLNLRTLKNEGNLYGIYGRETFFPEPIYPVFPWRRVSAWQNPLKFQPFARFNPFNVLCVLELLTYSYKPLINILYRTIDFMIHATHLTIEYLRLGLCVIYFILFKRMCSFLCYKKGASKRKQSLLYLTYNIYVRLIFLTLIHFSNPVNNCYGLDYGVYREINLLFVVYVHEYPWGRSGILQYVFQFMFYKSYYFDSIINHK